MQWRLILFLIPFNLLALQVHSQHHQLIGNWVKINATTTDGSSVIDATNIDLLEMDLHIANATFCVRYYPLTNANCFSYYYNGINKKVQFSDRSWSVLEINQDFLKLYMHGEGIHKDIIVSFVKEASFYKDYEITKDGEYIIATSRFSPLFNSNLKTYLDQALKSNKTTGKAIADLKIDFKKQTIQIDWKEIMGYVDKVKIEKVFNKSFRIWQNISKEYDKYIIPFTLQFRNEDQLSPLKFNFYTDQFQSVFDNYSVSNENIIKSKQLFKKAHLAFQKEDYGEALNKFKACYAINPTELRAMYNVAHIYNKLGQNKNACLVYQHLIDKGQQKAKTLSEKNCKSN